MWYKNSVNKEEKKLLRLKMKVKLRVYEAQNQ